MLPNREEHPEDLFEAYALDALDTEEAVRVESHLEHCSRCRVLAGEALDTVTFLTLAVDRSPAPAGILARVRAELSPAEMPTAATGLSWSFPRSFPRSFARSFPQGFLPSWFTLRRLAFPAVGIAVIALLGLSVTLNLRLSGEMDEMAQRNSTVTAQMAGAIQETERLTRETSVLAAQLESSGITSLAQISGLTGTLISSYLDAFPDTQPVMLEPSDTEGGHEGFLMVDEEGMKATMMISNQNPASTNNPYLVWLVSGSDWTPAGQVTVDSSGQGTLDIEPDQSVFAFDSVNVTVDGGENTDQEELVLSSRIPHQANPK